MEHTKSEFQQTLECLHSIQQRLKITNGSYSEFGDFTYATIDDIFEKLRPLLNELGCVIFFKDGIDQKGDKHYVLTTLHFVKTDCPDTPIKVTAMAREPESKPKMDASQVTGSASTYAHKLALKSLFAISDEKDADALAKMVENSGGKAVNKAKLNERQMKEAMSKIDSVTSIDELNALWIDGYKNLAAANPQIKAAFSTNKAKLQRTK